MGAIGPMQIAIIVLVGLLLFGGRGRISSILGDAGRGINVFKRELNAPEGEDSAAPNPQD